MEAVVSLAQYYDQQLRCFTFGDFQIVPTVEEYRQQMELLLLRAGLREEERTNIARFLSGFNMEVRDKVELLCWAFHLTFSGIHYLS